MLYMMLLLITTNSIMTSLSTLPHLIPHSNTHVGCRLACSHRRKNRTSPVQPPASRETAAIRQSIGVPSLEPLREVDEIVDLFLHVHELLELKLEVLRVELFPEFLLVLRDEPLAEHRGVRPHLVHQLS